MLSMMDHTSVPSVIDLVNDGVVDAELAALVWLLVEGGVPLTVTGRVAVTERTRVAQAVLAVPPDGSAVLIDADAERPGLGSLGARIQGGVRVGLTIAAADLRAAMDRLAAPPDGLPEDAVRRLGVVLVVGEVPSTTVGPVVDRVRVLAAHYLRPTERDPQGHIQRRPPAVLATWVVETDTFDHFAWGMTPELADLVDRTQASFEELQSSRAAALRSLVASRPTDAAAVPAALAAVLAAEPVRQPAIRSPLVRTAAAHSPLTDPHVH
jgi:hypothetical protein